MIAIEDTSVGMLAFLAQWLRGPARPNASTGVAALVVIQQPCHVTYLMEENRILRGHLRHRLRLTDEERRRLARHGHRLGRQRLGELATIVTPDTICGGIGN